MPKKKWSQDEINKAKEYYSKGYNIKIIAKKLDRTVDSIRGMIYKKAYSKTIYGKDSFDDLGIIVDNVCELYGISKEILFTKTNRMVIVRPRQFCHILAKKLTNHSLAIIGIKIGGKDHATVLNSIGKIEGFLSYDKKIIDNYNFLYKKSKKDIHDFNKNKIKKRADEALNFIEIQEILKMIKNDNLSIHSKISINCIINSLNNEQNSSS